MHGPLTLQNIYQAIPAATLQFAEGSLTDILTGIAEINPVLDEYVWQANRPVNMILASGVQWPNVLTEAAANTNLEGEQFFSRIIEDLLLEYQKRHPSDRYAALKQWKQKHVSMSIRVSETFIWSSSEDVDHYAESATPKRMNGFEALLDVVHRRHLGKTQRYFLNVVSTHRHFHPYDLITVSESKVCISFTLVTV